VLSVTTVALLSSVGKLHSASQTIQLCAAMGFRPIIQCLFDTVSDPAAEMAVVPE
jgi:hypothetical protein